MKTLARLAAALSFTSFLLAGLAILTKAHYSSAENSLAIALGLFLIGTAFFAGPMLWLAAEKCASKQDAK